MRIYADKLDDHLSRSLMQVYLLFGNEPLLIDESRRSIDSAARKQGFEERSRYIADATLNWDHVFNQCQSLSLFSSRQIIEIEVPESGLSAPHAKELASLAQQLNNETLLVVLGGKLTKAQETSKWFTSFLTNGCWVSCLTPDLQRLPQFVAQRCRSLGLNPDPEAIQMLAQWHEGNLLALIQSLEKLALIYPDGRLTLIRLEQALSRSNHYTPFQWVDALLEGKSNRAQRILRDLEADGTEVIILLRTIQKEIMLLLEFERKMTNQPLNTLFDKARIWNSKRPLYTSALRRLNRAKLRHIIRLLCDIEMTTKTQYLDTPWPLLHQLSVEISHEYK
jgi:DNA polymerase III subunit delta